ncbi:hypothetical protein BG011_006120 [Mortierella polycephala]|uniref:Mechanosensitive ion channel MscS domain-containing protein n=1 Tax=Mortierella polycephala TaxID=41804 RepID=A0A9P6PWY4_9FUNG|nr:hypothetical protein BG011_006120 [Mortierella polycephala]
MLIKCGSMAVGRRNSEMKDSAPKRAREVETQIVVMTRIIQGMIWMLGLAGIAMTFPNAWQVGLSLLASASVSALLLGFAAKSSIENALASLTIALTQPFLLEDQVMVDDEVGHIEEIQSQYVIVRTLDERRLVVPLTWFLGNIFQNWSRNSPQQISECKVFVDYTFSVPRIRQAFLKFARAHPMFDGRHCALLVTDCTDKTIELTCQISVRNAMNVIQITSDVREAMVEFIAKGHQQQTEVKLEGTQSRMTMSDRGSEGYDCGSSSSTPPPLTEEDEKMGGGSKVYHQTCRKEKMGVPESVALALEPSAVHNTGSSDHIKVTVEGPTPNSNKNTLDRDTGQPDAVVPQLRMSEAQLSEK